MASKQSRGSIPVSPRKADEFKLIRGIGPALADRIQDAGIRTFAQLASLSPAELAARLRGISAKQIARQGWIRQARKLTPRSPRSKRRKKETVAQALRQHYENFTIEFLLDEKNEARRTRVVHIQSGDVDTWAKWDTERLIDFLARHAEARLPNSTTANLSNIKPELPPQPSLATKQPSGLKASVSAEDALSVNPLQQSPSSPLSTRSVKKIHLIKWEILFSKANQIRRNLTHDRPFDVKLTLDVTNASLPDLSQINFTASLYAKKLGDGPRQAIAETQGTMPYMDIIDFTISNAALAQGFYRLAAFVRLTSDDSTASVTALLKGDLLPVY